MAAYFITPLQTCLTTTISCRTRAKRSKPAAHSKHVTHSKWHSYEFEYESGDDEDQGGDVDIENKYYNAKQLKAEDPETAIDEFLGVPALEEEKGDWYGL